MPVNRTPDNFARNTNPTDYSSDHKAHVSHFGVLKAGPTIPVFKANFPGTSLNTDQWVDISENSATLTVADGMGRLQSGTNSAGSVSVRSRQKGRFEAGQVSATNTIVDGAFEFFQISV